MTGHHAVHIKIYTEENALFAFEKTHEQDTKTDNSVNTHTHPSTI